VEDTTPADGPVDAAAVQRVLQLQSTYMASRVLAGLDPTGEGFASVAEMTQAAESLLSASVQEQLQFFVRVHDHDGSGRIDRDEFERMVHLGLAEHRLTLAAGDADRLVASMFGDVDADGDNVLTLAELTALLERRPELEASLVGYGVSLLVPGHRAEPEAERAERDTRWTGERVVVAVALALFIVANLAAFSEAFFRYRTAGANIWIQVARGCAGAIHVNAALIVVPMLRHLLTWVRRRRIARYIPLDDAVDAHRLIGETLMWLSVVHVVAHVINVATTATPWSVLFTGSGLTGVLLTMVFAGLWWFSRARVRRKGEFELFHWTHLLFVPFFVLAILHGPYVWAWVALPLLAYVAERVQRSVRAWDATDVLAATALPAGVVRLDIRRPDDFDYNAGDFAFIKLPALAGHEWHPFTLTSAPNQAGLLTFHISALGNWTRALRSRVEEGNAPTAVHIDGPYGAPATHIHDTEHVIAVGGGIGVTPFASILRRVALESDSSSRLKKLHFVWIAREAGSFQWFADLLWRIEALDTANRIDIHLYMTQGRKGLGGAFEIARQLDHETHADILTGLAGRTRFGRPDLDALLAEFADTPDLPKPHVFFCGPQGLSRMLRRASRAQGLPYRDERF